MTTITDFKITLMSRYEYEEDDEVTEEKIVIKSVTGLEREYDADFIMWINEDGNFVPYSIYVFIVSDEHDRTSIRNMLMDMNSKLVSMIKTMCSLIMVSVDI